MLAGSLLALAGLGAFVAWASHQYTVGFLVRPMSYMIFSLIGGTVGLAGRMLWNHLCARLRSG